MSSLLGPDSSHIAAIASVVRPSNVHNGAIIVPPSFATTPNVTNPQG